MLSGSFIYLWELTQSEHCLHAIQSLRVSISRLSWSHGNTTMGASESSLTRSLPSFAASGADSAATVETRRHIAHCPSYHRICSLNAMHGKSPQMCMTQIRRQTPAGCATSHSAAISTRFCCSHGTACARARTATTSAR